MRTHITGHLAIGKIPRVSVAALLAAACACFATKNDVRLIDTDLRTGLASNRSAADSAAAKTQRLAQDHAEEMRREIRILRDSLQAGAAREAAADAKLGGEIAALEQVVNQAMRLIEQAVKRIDDARREAGAIREEGSTGSRGAPAANVAPGPNVAFLTARDAFNDGAFVTARAGFDQLITSWPNAPEVPLAQYYVGETYLAMRDSTRADSVYRLAAQRFPESSVASRAVYKRALLMIAAGRVDEARATLRDLLNRFPKSDEAKVARDRLQQLERRP